jgi:hypothetical protein
MYPWGTLGIFVLGAGVGALTTAALHIGQIRKLKELLKAAHNKPQAEGQSAKSDGRKSARAKEPQ